MSMWFDLHDMFVYTMYVDMVDGREVSETERQFLASWKATRKARRKAMQENRELKGGYTDV